MKMTRLVICAAVATAGWGACVVLPAAEAQTVIQIPQAKVAFVCPANYHPSRRSNANAALVFSYDGSPMSGGSGLPANINLTKRVAPTGLTVFTPVQVEAMIPVVRRSVPSYQKQASGTVKVGGETGAFLVGSFQISGRTMQTKQILVVHQGQLYAFTFGAVTPDFAKQVGAFDKMIASVKWL